MKKLLLLKLKHRILFRKVLLNVVLFMMPTNNKLVILLSQNLDKYIALQQKELFIKYCLKSKDIVDEII